MKDQRKNNKDQRRKANSGVPAQQQTQQQAPAPAQSKSAPRRRHQHEAPPIKFRFVQLNCVLCGEVIQEMSSAIAYGSFGEPAHFECVQKKLEAIENLSPDEKIVYWGAGQFAIIKSTPETSFSIVKKISVEQKDLIPDWRRDIKTQVRSNE